MSTLKTDKGNINKQAVAFCSRLQEFTRKKKIKQIEIARTLNRERSQISKWFNNTKALPSDITIQLLADTIGCDFDWLKTGKGKAHPRDAVKTAEETLDFGTYKRASDIGKENEMAKILFFKQQCLGFFDEFFEFVAEYYGPDKDGVDRFLADLHNGFANYRDFMSEKKAARENIQTEEQDNLIANEK